MARLRSPFVLVMTRRNRSDDPRDSSTGGHGTRRRSVGSGRARTRTGDELRSGCRGSWSMLSGQTRASSNKIPSGQARTGKTSSPESVGAVKDRRTAGTVDLHGQRPWIEEPAEANALVDIFLHLPADLGLSIRRGQELDNEIGTDRGELLFCSGVSRSHRSLRDPGCVGGMEEAVGEGNPLEESKPTPSPLRLVPDPELAVRPGIAGAAHRSPRAP